MRRLLLVLPLIAACAPQPETTVEERAEAVAAATLATLQPGSDPATATCVRDHAKFEELLTLSTDDPRRPSIEAVALVQDLLTREEVKKCLELNSADFVE